MSTAYSSTNFGAAGAEIIDLRGLLVSALRYAPGTRTPPHDNEGSCLTVTTHGSWVVHDGSLKSYACAKGTVHVVPSGARYHSRFEDAGARMLAIYVPGEWREQLGSCGTALGSIRHFRDGRIEELARSALLELSAPDDAAPLALEGLALEMLACAARPHRSAPGEQRSRWLLRVEERVRAEFRAPPSWKELAREAGVHPVHLARSFRAATGLSPAGFVRRLRLEWATEQLLQGRKPLAEVAAEAGFADQSHFTRLFRARTGLTPALYRNRFRG